MNIAIKRRQHASKFSESDIQIGFTLIEMMITVFILSILAAIAIPTYRQSMVNNAESQAQAEMLRIEIDLNRWRASALSYKGFQPKSGIDGNNKVTYGYVTGTTPANTIIYLPRGSTAANYRYRLTLVDGLNTTQSLVPLASSGLNMTTGRTWRMLAEPNATGVTQDAHIFLLSSTGLKCKNKLAANISLTNTDCGAGGSSW